MSSQERFDVVLKCLNGPLQYAGEQVVRGPVVRIGGEPGPGGFELSGYRGLDKRHAVITAYDKGNATIAPVGTNQVRMAPHPNVRWKDIDPMSGPQHLSEGCAIHLGPVGRGATLEFVEVRKLGVWERGSLASEAHGAAVASDQALGKRAGLPPVGGVPGAPPAAFDARKSQTIRASTVPIWFIGCAFLMAMFFATSILAVVLIQQRDVEEYGPVAEGQEFYDYVDATNVDAKLLDGLRGGFQAFVMRPNAQAARLPRLEDPENWDQNFYDHVVASVHKHVQSWSFFRTLDSIRDDYAEVVMVMRRNDLPDVFAAIPYLESRYKRDAVSDVCAAGYWQFMPEVARRVDKETDIGFVVKNCRFQDGVVWNPTQLAPPGIRRSPYVDYRDGTYACRIDRCEVDDRKDLGKSSEAAAYTLKEAFEDPDLARSGAAVQMAIMSHNMGYDDRRFGKGGKWNVLHAYRRWRKDKPESVWQDFYGDNITCGPGADRLDSCGGVILNEPQHYTYNIVAEHLVAVCYYALNYPEVEAFRKWDAFTRGDGYCNGLKIPRASEVYKPRKK